MEEAVCACRDCLVAVHTTWAQHTDWRLLAEHGACLYAGGVGAKQNIGWLLHANLLLNEERVLHVASRVLWCEVKQRVNVVIVLYLRAFRYGKAHASEDVDDLLTHKRKWVTCTQCNRVRSTGEVEFLGCCFSAIGLYRFAQLIDTCLVSLTQCVECLTNLTFLLFRYFAKLVEEFGNQTFLTEVFDAQCL